MRLLERPAGHVHPDPAARWPGLAGPTRSYLLFPKRAKRNHEGSLSCTRPRGPLGTSTVEGSFCRPPLCIYLT